MIVGFAAGVFWQQILLPDQAAAKTAQYHSAAAPQAFKDELALKPAQPMVTPPVKPEAKPTPATKTVASAPVAINIPEFAPPKELSGDLSGLAPLPSVQIAPVQAMPAASKPKALERKADADQELKSAKARALRDRIANMRMQREELLKSFYEDAIPVKHLDEDIAAAEAELKELKAI